MGPTFKEAILVETPPSPKPSDEWVPWSKMEKNINLLYGLKKKTKNIPPQNYSVLLENDAMIYNSSQRILQKYEFCTDLLTHINMNELMHVYARHMSLEEIKDSLEQEEENIDLQDEIIIF